MPQFFQDTQDRWQSAATTQRSMHFKHVHGRHSTRMVTHTHTREAPGTGASAGCSSAPTSKNTARHCLKSLQHSVSGWTYTTSKRVSTRFTSSSCMRISRGIRNTGMLAEIMTTHAYRHVCSSACPSMHSAHAQHSARPPPAGRQHTQYWHTSSSPPACICMVWLSMAESCACRDWCISSLASPSTIVAVSAMAQAPSSFSEAWWRRPGLQ